MSDFTNESVSAIETTLNDVDRALERLRLGTYRACQVCGTPIDDADLEADYIVVELARHLLGSDWMADYVRRANSGGIERVLV